MGKECCANREAALAAGKKSQMTAIPFDRSLGRRGTFPTPNLRVDCPEARQSDEQIGSFAFQKRRNYSIERRMVLVRDRWAASEEAVTTPLYWALTGHLAL